MDRTPQRREKLDRTFKADRIEAFLVSSVANVSYLSGFSGEDSTLLLTRNRAIVLSDGRYTTQLQQECPGLEQHIRQVGQLMVDAIAEVVDKIGVHRLGFEASAMSVADFETLKEKLPGVEWVGLKDRVEALRAIKDKDEVAAIREAIGFAERAFAMLRAGLRRDREREGRGRRAGGLPADAAAHRRPASRRSSPSGRRSALPHARPSARRPDRRGRLRAGRLGGDRAGPTKVT